MNTRQRLGIMRLLVELLARILYILRMEQKLSISNLQPELVASFLVQELQNITMGLPFLMKRIIYSAR